MSEASDIVDWLRELAADYAAYDHHSGQARLIEAATLIERQRYNLGRLETALVMARGSMAEKTEDTVPSFVILPAEPNAPR